MSSAVRSIVLGIVLAGSVSGLVSAAEMESSKPLPTLLIKGEVVSVDASDAAASLIKVKDRYGFETPIYLKSETKITQGDASASSSALTSGAAVEVEYNFDVNTAKRHAVAVKVAAPKVEEASAAPAEAAAIAVEPAAAIAAVEAAAVQTITDVAETVSAEAAPTPLDAEIEAAGAAVPQETPAQQ